MAWKIHKGDKLNPYSYAQTLQELMLKKAISNHFDLEKELLCRDVRIKPLTLFFIDNIESYRNKEGHLRKLLESFIRVEVTQRLQTEKHIFYRRYLEKTLEEVSLTHGAYFSKDNTDKDEAIEKEINEILHDKQTLLSLDNPRRFIFSKWTLREGWDNPNVFQICKLRSSGSEISKLQEVGRGLRLPVNEYGHRVKNESFYLNYFVDFTESNFIDSLISEINKKSKVISVDQIKEKLEDDLIRKIVEKYHLEENQLLQKLTVDDKIIDFSRKFLLDGFQRVKMLYPLAFDGIDSDRIRKSNQMRSKVRIRSEKYNELKSLWEKLNEKVILEYRFNNEDEFISLLSNFFKIQKEQFQVEQLNEKKLIVAIENGKAIYLEENSVLDSKMIAISTMRYSDFLKELSKVIYVNLNSLHKAIINSGIDLNAYMNATTIRLIKQAFNKFLLYNAIDKFSINYKKITNSIHPTKLTDKKGNILTEINASDIGMLFTNEGVANSYLFDELYYDSLLEKENIKTTLKEVIVFTKIPRNSIKIPLVGGSTYSPDFAYILNFENGNKQLNFIVETKNIDSKEVLRHEELQKIRHAEEFFKGEVKIHFKTQFSNNNIAKLIQEAYYGMKD
ncbi:Type III restriction-modification system EcoPI enzyme res (fragment) [Capnocytophaga canimorsus]|uniref:Type III restriction-modification system EcoPI enzyme res n=1 Tax=Capnocytophaga canimorsus TaxID=28188 RepID=A0A0B7IKE3_9FLAO